VIGRRGRYIPRAEALDYVAGYSCYNDGSVRDWQRHTTQFTPGKNFPKTGGFGPYLVTPDEVGDVQNLNLETRLNGHVVQRTNTADMTYTVAHCIEYISSFTELVPGDVISTGTPSGVGAARKPPLWMKAGDVVEVEIEKVGLLRNPIADE
jgi:2-keto-4-pentenoate hydratase/2-oxohepta-3-ene-1,7-dioic acid hydratase in catechol pathway